MAFTRRTTATLIASALVLIPVAGTAQASASTGTLASASVASPAAPETRDKHFVSKGVVRGFDLDTRTLLVTVTRGNDTTSVIFTVNADAEVSRNGVASSFEQLLLDDSVTLRGEGTSVDKLAASGPEEIVVVPY